MIAAVSIARQQFKEGATKPVAASVRTVRLTDRHNRDKVSSQEGGSTKAAPTSCYVIAPFPAAPARYTALGVIRIRPGPVALEYLRPKFLNTRLGAYILFFLNIPSRWLQFDCTGHRAPGLVQVIVHPQRIVFARPAVRIALTQDRQQTS